jgi:hypothetical protein
MMARHFNPVEVLVSTARRLSLVTFSLILALSLASGCKRGPKVDPMKAAMSSYKQAIEPPIQKSEEIARLFVQIVLDDKGNPNPDNAAKRIETEIIPKAQEFLDAIKAIQPTDANLIDLHKVLVQAATLRLEGYQQLAQGFAQKNMDLFTQGQKKVTESKIQEDTFVARADQLMRAQGYELVYFAAPPPAAP